MKYLMLLLLTITLPANSQNLKGKIVEVIDADVVIFQERENIERTIILDGIVAPRIDMPYGEQAFEFMRRKCEGYEAIVKITSTDNDTQTFGIIYVNGVNINEALLIEGLAWKSIDNNSAHLSKLEENARNAKINIWSIEYPVQLEQKPPIYETNEAKVYVCSLTPNIYHRNESCPILNNCKSKILREHFLVAREKKPCLHCSMRNVSSKSPH